VRSPVHQDNGSLHLLPEPISVHPDRPFGDNGQDL